MSDPAVDPLLGLLTDIVSGLANLIEKVDSIESKFIAQQELVNEALATIAEIAARTYFATSPPASLPDDIVNASVMSAMVERWPPGDTVGLSRADRDLLTNVGKLDVERIEALIAQATANPDQSNAGRLRRSTSLALLDQELGKRMKLTLQSEEGVAVRQGR